MRRVRGHPCRVHSGKDGYGYRSGRCRHSFDLRAVFTMGEAVRSYRFRYLAVLVNGLRRRARPDGRMAMLVPGNVGVGDCVCRTKGRM